MRSRVALVALAVLLLVPASAPASLLGEQRKGQQLIAGLQAGTRTCGQLSANDFDHIGEYVMFRALGSTTLHQAVNRRMIAMMSEQGESRMHQLLGQRYTGCSSDSRSGAYGAMGPGMMGGYRASAGTIAPDGWSAAAIVAVTLGGAVLAALMLFAVIRRTAKKPPAVPVSEPAQPASGS